MSSIVEVRRDFSGYYEKTNPVPTSNNQKWWNSWWKTKNHSKELERRRSSTASSITSNGDFFAEDVSYSLFSLFKLSIES
jgi:hypothetical protein